MGDNQKYVNLPSMFLFDCRLFPKNKNEKYFKSLKLIIFKYTMYIYPV